MTEAEWLTCEDPEPMYATAEAALSPKGSRSTRKRDFFCAACCRLVWPWVAVDDCCRRAIEELETQFDAPASEAESDDLWDGVKQSARHPAEGTPIAQLMAANLVYDAGDAYTVILRLVADYDFPEWGTREERAAQVAHVMRDIVGNPFRPISFDPSWRTDTVLALARQMYESRDFSAMPILADALQDAGCDNPDILNHCRADGVHVRGCWVVDLVLGKS